MQQPLDQSRNVVVAHQTQFLGLYKRSNKQYRLLHAVSIGQFDLEDFNGNGGKIIHYHDESDPSIPSGSSVIYHEAVRNVMCPGMGFNESYAALNEWYRFFLVPGAGHCGRSSSQSAGPWPTDLLGSLINWVENGQNPTTPNATTPSGDSEPLCTWPLRPLWSNNGADLSCVYDQSSIDTWIPNLNSIPIPTW